jgi:DNA-binding GntR family transcriptional regulator
MSWATDTPISISQENLSVMTSTSRKQVNSAIQRFVAAGWVEIGYRSVTVTNPSALRRRAEQDVAN